MQILKIERYNFFNKAAPTRCDPELDTGYTLGDFKHNANFCIHFARGCCV